MGIDYIITCNIISQGRALRQQALLSTLLTSSVKTAYSFLENPHG
nr:MAG TPA: hypothetical protein [Caudoviricetes sp.]